MRTVARTSESCAVIPMIFMHLLHTIRLGAQEMWVMENKGRNCATAISSGVLL